MRSGVPVGRPPLWAHHSVPLRNTAFRMRGSLVSMREVVPSWDAPICEYEKLLSTKNRPVPGKGPPARGAQLGDEPVPVMRDSRSRKTPLDDQPLLSTRYSAGCPASKVRAGWSTKPSTVPAVSNPGSKSVTVSGPPARAVALLTTHILTPTKSPPDTRNMLRVMAIQVEFIPRAG